MQTSVKFPILFLLWLVAISAFGQAPVITYTTPNVYTVGAGISPLLPKNTGGAVPANTFGQVTAFAGGPGAFFLDGQGTAATFRYPEGMAIDKNKNIYVADRDFYRIRKVSPSGLVSTYAGTDQYGHKDGPKESAQFVTPMAVAVDNDGNVFVGDYLTIRKIDLAGNVTTIAGGADVGYIDDKGTNARFNGITGMVVDKAGNLFVTDLYNYCVRKITPDGNVTTFAGNGASGYSNGQGTAASFWSAQGIAIDAQDNIYITDYTTIRKITPTGFVSNIAGTGSQEVKDGPASSACFVGANGIVVDANGDIYVSDAGWASNLIRKISKGVVSTLTQFSFARGMVLDGAGKLFVESPDLSFIAAIDITGYKIDKQLPDGLVFDPTTGIITGTPTVVWPATDYVVTAYNAVGSSSFTLSIEVKAAALPPVVVNPPNITYTTPNVYQINKPIASLNPANTGGAVPATVYGQADIFAGTGLHGTQDGNVNQAQFTEPYGMTTDADGNIYLADADNYRIRKITPGGMVSTLAPDGIPGGPNFASPKFNLPHGVVRDAAGNLFVANYSNHNILKITPDGTITVFAGGLLIGTPLDGQGTAASIVNPNAIAIDAAGNLYVSDGSNLIRKISPAGYVYTFVGSGDAATVDGKYSAASFNQPAGMVVDAAGNIYVAEQKGNVIRKITPFGDVTTIAGSGQFGANDGAGTAASFASPTGITIDKSGNLYVTDWGNGKIRKISPDMVVTTVAGGGLQGTNSGVGNQVYFNLPAGITLDADGNLLVSELNGNIIKKVIATGYTIDKALPPGLVFDPKTGIITGKPTVLWPATDYKVTAYNAGGSSSFTLNIEVKANVVPPVVAAPPNITYATPNVYTVNKVIPALTPKNTGGPVPATIYGQVSTFAGSGIQGNSDGTGAGATFYFPFTVAVDLQNNVYVADEGNHNVRTITPAGVVKTLAGNGNSFSVDGIGLAASFDVPLGISTNAEGNIFLSDAASNLIRQITQAGEATTYAGSGGQGFDNGPRHTATFKNSAGTVTDASGNLYIADLGNNVIRKIDGNGNVSTFAGSGIAGNVNGLGLAASFNAPNGLAIDGNGNIYVADENNNLIRKITPAGLVSTLAGSGAAGAQNGTGTTASFYLPISVTVDAANNVYVAELGNNLIRKITPGGVVTTIAGSGQGGAIDGIGNQASFNGSTGVAADHNGNLYVGDFGNHKVRKILITGYTIDKALPAGLVFDSTTGIITGTPTVVWPATDYVVTAYNAGGSSSFTLNIEVKANVVPPAVVVPPIITYTTPNVYTVNKVIPALTPKNTGGPVPATIYGQVTTFAGGGKGGYFSNPTRLVEDASGNLYVADRDNNLIKKITPDGVVTVFAIGFNQPNGVTIDSKGNIFVADAASNQIKKITPDGTVSVFAGSGSPGHVNGPAGQASFYYPYSVVADKNDNLYVADSQNNLIRKVTPAGDVSTFAGSGAAGLADGNGTLASFYSPSGVNIDADGNVYVADHYRVRIITPSGDVTTIAGSGGIGSSNGAALSATFNGPVGVAVDAAGNVYVADILNNLIRKMDPQGIVTTLAGSGASGAADGVGALASFGHPNDVQVNPNGFLYITDSGSSLIRKVIVTGYTIDKALPDGLTFDPTTGIITGTPTVTWPATDYLVTAYNTGGSSSFTVNIKVTELVGSISASTVSGNISNCENVASGSYQQFAASGTLLSQSIKVTAPASFLVSLSPTAGYNNSITLALSGDKVNPTTIYVKLDDKAIAGNYAGNVVLSSAGAADVLAPVNAEVHKLPVVDPISDQPGVCSGTTLTVNFAGTADVYSWANTDTRIGLAASGTGNLSFKAQNSTSAPIIATITVTPNSTSGICPGNPVTFKITVTPSATPVVDIKQVNVTCPGQSVIFSATAGNAGLGPIYQWQVNGSNAGTNNAVFSSSTLQANDLVTCTVTNTGNFCNTPALSNTLKVFFKPDDAPPTVSIDKAGDVSGCAGTDFTFTAIAVNEGINPTYQWLLNGLPVANNTGKTYTRNTLVNGDRITCAVINNDGCNPIVSPVSAPANIVIAPSQQVSTVVVNSSLTMPVCAGSAITFTPTPANYQTSAGVPTYVWYVNGSIVGAQDTYTTNTLIEGDLVYCVMTTYNKCFAPLETKSNTIKVTYRQAPAPPAVSISPSGGIASCVGLQLTFTAASQGAGTNPTYQWMVNGQQINNQGSVFTTSTLAMGDKVTCIVINNDGCTPVSSPLSEAADIIATPVQVSTVTIAASVTMPVCTGKEITFIPTPSNYQTSGGVPTYVWYVNGKLVSDKDTYTTKTLADADQVYCIMTTYGACVAPTPAQSNTINVSLAPESGCIIPPIVIPNAFTPNADGHNDTWNIPALANYPGCIVNVFNRYGISVFRSVDYTKAWNGNYNNNAVPSGTYYYIIDPKNGGTKLSGYVVVIR